MLKGIDHIELVVKDIELFISFFEKLGFEIIRRTEHHKGSAELKLPGKEQIIFELHRIEEYENPGINHIAFACDDINKTYKSMMDQGIMFEKAPYHASATGRIIANFRDPDGRRMQLVDARSDEYIKGEKI